MDKTELLNRIRKYLIENIYRNTDIMFNDTIRPDNSDIDLIDIITGLYELLHLEITGESYDYMWHWANKIGADIGTYDFINYLKEEQI